MPKNHVNNITSHHTPMLHNNKDNHTKHNFNRYKRYDRTHNNYGNRSYSGWYPEWLYYWMYPVEYPSVWLYDDDDVDNDDENRVQTEELEHFSVSKNITELILLLIVIFVLYVIFNK